MKKPYLFFFIPIIFLGNPAPIEIDEPDLIGPDLRLSAMGDIGIVITGFTNEINSYDFGELGAGIIEDNEGNSYFLIPGIFGSDMTEEIYEQKELYMDKLSCSGYTKITDRNVFGISGGIYRKRARFHSWGDMSVVKSNYKNLNDTLIFAHRFNQLIAGFRGGYDTQEKIEKHFYGLSNYKTNILHGEPSLIFKTRDNLWTLGFGYEYERLRQEFAHYGEEVSLIQTLKVPLIFTNPSTNLGIKFNFQLAKSPFDTTIQEGGLVKIQLLDKIRLNEDKYLMFGLVTGWEDQFTYRDLDFKENKQLTIGFGLSYVKIVGIQYEHEIHEYGWTSIHFNRFTQGCEVFLTNQLPIRLGYSFGFASQGSRYYSNELESILSAGLGFYPNDSKIKIDIAGRLNFYRYDNWWYTYLSFGICFKSF